MTSSPTLTPELLGLLDEIAHDPASSLLKVTPRQLALSLRSEIPRRSYLETGLRPAERELLRVHREEVAFCLASACQSLLSRDPALGPQLFFGKPDGSRYRPPGIDWIEAHAKRLRQIDTGEDFGACCSRMLSRLCPDEKLPSVVEVAVVSYSLVPRGQTRIYHALGQIALNDVGAAQEILEQYLQRTSTPFLRASALVNLGWTHSILGSDAAALAAYRNANLVGQLRLLPLSFQLILALQLNAGRKLAERTAAVIDDHFSPTCDSVPQATAQLKLMGMGRLRRTAFRRRAAPLMESAGPVTRSILHAVS